MSVELDYLRYDGVNPDALDGEFTGSRSVRSTEQMEEQLHGIEARLQTDDITDENGKKICAVSRDLENDAPYVIQAEPYENLTQEAEHPNELICITNEDGSLTGERMTRQEAREQKKRYLVVSLLLQHHGAETDRICVARRSEEKKIDPGKESISAHGVAKLLHDANGQPITDLRTTALVNTALELNEELRHGKGSTPFNVIVWPGSERELYQYAHEHGINDPNTVYLAGGLLFADHGYPLHEWRTPRTRFIINGHVFSKDTPAVQSDPSEVDGTEWVTLKAFAFRPIISEDSVRCAEEGYGAFLESKTQWGFYHSARWVRNAVNAVFHPDEPYIPKDY